MSAYTEPCLVCPELRAQLDAATQRARDLETLVESLRTQLRQATDLIELQDADIARYRAEQERTRPNRPEHMPQDQLQLAFEHVVASFADSAAARELADAAAANDDADSADSADGDRSPPPTKPRGKGRHRHGRRRLDLTNLPVEKVVLDPDEVVAKGGEGFEFVDEEITKRLAFRPGTYVRLEVVRRKWVRVEQEQPAATSKSLVPITVEEDRPSRMVVAPLPDSLWPTFMADASAIADVIISKYDDSLPLHRQERISARNGFHVPRSTQCSWLTEAYKVLYRIVDAMFMEGVRTAFCMATDATGAPVRARGSCDHWHIFVFIADKDHVVFRYTERHDSEAVQGFLVDFKGHLLSDAAAVYDVLHRNGAIEVACWFHLRRHFWRGLEVDRQRAIEALSIISKLFEVARDCRDLPEPERTTVRAARCRPILALFDAWVARNRDAFDPRGTLAKGVGYYTNQRAALHRFLDDGRLRLDNSISEQQLRKVVLGRHNWMFFENETGLKWYTTFRSLIASCALHGINAHQYLEQVLRLAPHWPVSRVLELAPKYWKATVARLDEQQRRILTPPWQCEWPALAALPKRGRAAEALAKTG